MREKRQRLVKRAERKVSKLKKIEEKYFKKYGKSLNKREAKNLKKY